MMREVDTIDVKGVNGDFCRISPPGYSWGPELAPKSTGLFDMAIQTNWGVGPFGQFFSSWKPKARDVVWTIHIMNPDDGSSALESDADLWRTVYSRWKNMFAPDRDATIIYTSSGEERTLGLKTSQANQSFSSQSFEGHDPNLFAYGSVVQTMRAELPFYVGKSDKFGWETPSSGSFWFTLPYFNPSTIDVWPEWDLDGGAQWTLPDYSFGLEAHGRGQADKGKTVPIPNLLVGENVTVMTRPDMEWIISEWETDPSLRSPGLRHEYPIGPGQGDSTNGCVVRCNNATTSDLGCVLTLPRWYDTPFSVPVIV